VIQRYKDYSLLEALPTTGRTHQIRVHLASMGFPVVGDATYGRSQIDFDRHFLHAKTLEFKHPSTGVSVKLEAKLSSELEDFLEMISHTKIPN
jgi:23S rRNA-/tRNA-specific pseudouridylate synthase